METLKSVKYLSIGSSIRETKGGHKPGKPGKLGKLREFEKLSKSQGTLNFRMKNLENSGKMKNM